MFSSEFRSSRPCCSQPLAYSSCCSAEGFEPDILGLFTGNPHGTELAHDNPMPPQILLYLDSLWEFAEGDIDAFRDEVRLTYLHELGHFLGWDEDQITARGLE
jgi:predicted Zn-dependent protease with MMP-like domain